MHEEIVVLIADDTERASRDFSFPFFFPMVVMRPHHNCMKRARSQSMPTSEALPQACQFTRENAPRVGRILLVIELAEAFAASLLHTTLGNVW